MNYSDLYDASTAKNRTKIVTLTAEKPNTSRTLYLRTTPVEDGEVLTDVRPSNNVLPVALAGRYMPDVFTIDDARRVRQQQGMSNENRKCEKMIRQWVFRKYALQITDYSFEKCK